MFDILWIQNKIYNDRHIPHLNYGFTIHRTGHQTRRGGGNIKQIPQRWNFQYIFCGLEDPYVHTSQGHTTILDLPWLQELRKTLHRANSSLLKKLYYPHFIIHTLLSILSMSTPHSAGQGHRHRTASLFNRVSQENRDSKNNAFCSAIASIIILLFAVLAVCEERSFLFTDLCICQTSSSQALISHPASEPPQAFAGWGTLTSLESNLLEVFIAVFWRKD